MEGENRSMWVSGLLRGEAALTQKLFARQIPRTFHNPRFVHFSSQPTFFVMASDNISTEWPAPKVRETFLNYFKENGHTFGKSLLFSPLSLLAPRFAPP